MFLILRTMSCNMQVYGVCYNVGYKPKLRVTKYINIIKHQSTVVTRYITITYITYASMVLRFYGSVGLWFYGSMVLRF